MIAAITGVRRKSFGGAAMAVRRKDLSLDQFLELPEEKPALEFEDGRITQKPWPNGTHSVLQRDIGLLIDRFARPRKIALAFIELQVTFDGRAYVPDLAVYRWSRLPVDPDGKIADDFTESPDVAVEIVSPKQSTTALVRRCLWFVSHGVAVALLVDPAARSVLSFRPNQVPAPLTGSDRINLDDVLLGFALTVHDVFDLLRVE
jgi:Uma2 family endonuclease